MRLGRFPHSSPCVDSGELGGGTRPFAQTGAADTSTNVPWVALLTFGDGWHNNHHAFPWAARHGLTWREPDLTFALLRLLERCGVVWDLKVPSAEQIERAQRSDRLRTSKAPVAAGAGSL